MGEKRDLKIEERWGILHLGADHPPLWWRKDARGYSVDIADAGLFTEQRSTSQDGPRYASPLPRDEAKSPAEMVELLDEEIRRTDERLEKLCKLRDQVNRSVWKVQSTRDLVKRAVTCPVAKHVRMPRWSHVGDIFNLGSTSAVELCKRFGLDPDEPRGHDEEEDEEDL